MTQKKEEIMYEQRNMDYSDAWDTFGAEQIKKGIKRGSIRWCLGNLIFTDNFYRYRGMFKIVSKGFGFNAWVAFFIFKLFINPSAKVISKAE